MPYAAMEERGNGNMWLAAGGGALAGATAYATATEVHAAKTRASWALGLSIGVLGLALVNSGSLNTAQQQAQAIAQSANGLTFTAAGSTGTEVGGLRAQFVAGMNVLANVAYYANIFNWFNQQPTPQPVVVSNLPVTGGTTITQNNNNSLAVILLAGVVVAAVVMS